MPASVFDYTDYRSFLNDLLSEKRKNNDKSFSLGAISHRAKTLSKAHISLLLKGRRDLSAKRILPLGSAIGLKGRELRYFESLINFNQTENLNEREHFLQTMITLRPKRQNAN